MKLIVHHVGMVFTYLEESRVREAMANALVVARQFDVKAEQARALHNKLSDALDDALARDEAKRRAKEAGA